MRNLQANYDRLQAADTQVVGVSVDSPFANKAFADSVGAKFPIASDFFDNDQAVKDYGLWNDKYHSARRASFLIDKEGKIAEMQVDSKAIDPSNIVEACERKKHASGE